MLPTDPTMALSTVAEGEATMTSHTKGTRDGESAHAHTHGHGRGSSHGHGEAEGLMDAVPGL